VKTSISTAFPAVLLAALACGCTKHAPTAEAPRPVRAIERRYGGVHQSPRYFAWVPVRHVGDLPLRFGGKVAERRVDVGNTVREGDVLAVLDAVDYRLAAEAARQGLIAATAQAQQARSDQKRLTALNSDGSVSPSDDERAQSGAQRAQAAAEAEARKLELANNKLKYTVLRASQGGVVTAIRFEVGQVVAEGQPVVSIANQVEPEIVVDVPEDHFASFQSARFKASLASAPEDVFEVVVREMSPQAAAQTRTYRARLKPVTPRRLPLGATATLIAERPASDASVAALPAGAITQNGGKPAVWAVRREGADPIGTVNLVPVAVHGYRNEEVLVSGPPAGQVIVVAGVQKMAPGLRVALTGPPLSAVVRQDAK
jgi:RND family efflux transporter MFP subunit